MKKLGFNIDHIATLRNARNEGYPDLIYLAKKSLSFGADQITAHLREDRRHIKDQDIFDIKKYINAPLNMEMALTEEMINIAINLLPHSVCIVPESRNEITTEGGLNIIHKYEELNKNIRKLQAQGIKVSLFVDHKMDQILSCIDLKPDSIEINTGIYSNTIYENKTELIETIKIIAKKVTSNNIKVHAGHGLNLDNIVMLSQIPEIIEYNIGHFIIGYAIDVGLQKAISDIKSAINYH